jgi:hypothetical protein
MSDITLFGAIPGKAITSLELTRMPRRLLCRFRSPFTDPDTLEQQAERKRQERLERPAELRIGQLLIDTDGNVRVEPFG